MDFSVTSTVYFREDVRHLKFGLLDAYLQHTHSKTDYFTPAVHAHTGYIIMYYNSITIRPHSVAFKTTPLIKPYSQVHT